MDVTSYITVPINNIARREGKMQPRPQGAFPGFGGGTPKPGKSALGTRLAMVSNFVRTSAKIRYFPLIVMSQLAK